MVVNNFDLHGAPVSPDKAHAPLVIDAGAVLALPVSPQRFEPVGGRYSKVGERGSCQYSLQSRSRPSLDVGRQSPNGLSSEEALSVITFESPHE